MRVLFAHRLTLLPIRPTVVVRFFLLLPPVLLLAGCVLWPFNWPHYLDLMITPKEFRGDWVENDYGATVEEECNVGIGLWSADTKGTCIHPGHVLCDRCRPLPPGTPLKFLYRRTAGEGEEHALVQVGIGANARTVDAGRNWEDNLRAMMVRPGDRRPLPPVTAELLCAGTVVESEHGYMYVVKEHWTPHSVTPGHSFLSGTSITASIMHGLGVQVAVKGPPPVVNVVLRTRVTHPPMTDPQTSKIRTSEEWDWSMSSYWPRYTGWLFAESWQLVPGTWTIEILDERQRVLAAQQFQVSVEGN